MKFISCSEAANLLRFTERRIQQMCKNGEIPGAIKKGRAWMLPADAVGFKNSSSSAKKKPLPVGVSDFKKAVTNYYYVDKTLMIRDFLDLRPQVSLFTRPRRFGKTLNMDMLRVFFEKTEKDTSVYFSDKKIWQCGEEYTSYQGKYPVIFLTFKDVKCSTWEETYQKLTRLISLEFQRHSELSDSPKLNSYQIQDYREICESTADHADYQMALGFLSQILHTHYDQDVIIIIDEYDTPIQQGHSCNFYNEIISFMRNLFSGGLKDNPYLAYGFLTGILRVAKESIFSGLNNLKINSILDDRYSNYFGFTREEVNDLLTYYDAGDKFEEVCSWYDGYKFGNTEIFNPWSVINYVSDNCFPKAFWQSTGSNDIIGEIIADATPEITENLYKLLNGEKITTYVDTGVIYPEVRKNPYSIYSFLLIAGYLKVTDVYPQNDGNYMCDIAIPNKEIAFVYEKEVLSKMEQVVSNSSAVAIQQAIFKQDSCKLQMLLEEFMLKALSSFDGANEGFYHGMMLGLCAVMNNRYHIRSNRESGYGRFDIQLFPQNNGDPGFIFEFKHGKNTDELDRLADEALRQIEEQKYDTDMIAFGVNKVIKIGIAFHGKKAVVRK